MKRSLFRIVKRFYTPPTLNSWRNSLIFSPSYYKDRLNIEVGFKTDEEYLYSLTLNSKSFLTVSDIIQMKYDKNVKEIMENIVFINDDNGIKYISDTFHNLFLYYGGNDCDLTRVLVKIKDLDYGYLLDDKKTSVRLLNDNLILNPDLVELEYVIKVYNLPLENILFIHGCNKIHKNDLEKSGNDVIQYHSEMFDTIWDKDE